MEESKKQMPDGVYIITENNQIIPFNSSFRLTEGATYIGFVQGNHSFAIALHDVSWDEITLTTKESKRDHGGYKYRYVDAVLDWDGKENTERIKQIWLNPAIKMKDGEYIPTLAELYLICLNQKTINAAMRFVGGQELIGWYWSSTECSTDYAWSLGLNYGLTNNGPEDEDMSKVRLVKQFI